MGVLARINLKQGLLCLLSKENSSFVVVVTFLQLASGSMRQTKRAKNFLVRPDINQSALVSCSRQKRSHLSLFQNEMSVLTSVIIYSLTILPP